MPKSTLFQTSFLVSGIMCFDGCGNTIQGLLNSCIPSGTRLVIDAEPFGLGIHQLILTIESEKDNFIPTENFHDLFTTKIKDAGFEIIDSPEKEKANKPGKTNQINLLINLIAMALVITFALIFPPSILLTVGLTALSFLTTAFTSRKYLLAFFQHFKNQNWADMSTTISLGWFLSLAHTLFHAIKMPLASSFSMVFMSFIMPIMLIICINGMDEIKRRVMEKSKKIQLKGIKTLFPQMSEKYICYQLAPEDRFKLKQMLALSPAASDEQALSIQQLLKMSKAQEEQKNQLEEGMLIEVKPGECFPVDCILIKGNTVVDASLLTGESQQNKKLWQPIPAGAINLSHSVTVYATKCPYNSTVNSLLFRSNRSRAATTDTMPKFVYLYTALVLIGILSAILVPFALGVITIPLVMQNIIGILFSLCPCTIAIAHQLPKLLSLHQRNKKGIQLRDDNLINQPSDEIHTIVFDKTGTLTTGESVIESFDITLDSPLWQRIYILEKEYGRAHPLAKAIQKYYEKNYTEPLFDEAKDGCLDEKNRGLKASVQGKTLLLGSADYLQDNGILPTELDKTKIEQGFSVVCVAEDGLYKGAIYIKHEARKGILQALTRLKKENKKIMMLTGDNIASAHGFNKQINSIFSEKDIHAGKTPEDKEAFLSTLMKTNPRGVWFIGDGLNDAPCCRIVSEKGGISCAMNSTDKSAFFTDISLNGSLDYLFQHKKLNSSLKQIMTQNKGIVIYSTVAFLAFLISFSIAGIAVSPLIPMAIMLLTTLFVLFNSYRTQLGIDNALDKIVSWPQKLFGSNLSMGLLLGASTLLIVSTLIATIATGGLALPLIAFTTGAAMAVSSVCTLLAISLFAAFTLLLTTALLSKKTSETSPSLNQTQSTSCAIKEKSYELIPPTKAPVALMQQSIIKECSVLSP